MSSITYKVSSFEPFFGTFRTLVQNSNDKYKSIGICDLQPVLQKICRFFPDQDLRSFKILFRDMFVCWYIYLFGQKCVLCHTNQSVPFYGTLEFSSSPSISLFEMVMNVICSRTWIIMSHWNVYGVAVFLILTNGVG